MSLTKNEHSTFTIESRDKRLDMGIYHNKFVTNLPLFFSSDKIYFVTRCITKLHVWP